MLVLKPQGFIFPNATGSVDPLDGQNLTIQSYGSLLGRVLKNGGNLVGELGPTRVELVSRILVKDLQIAQDARLTNEGESFRLILHGYVFRQLYEISETRDLCLRIGCPVAASVAEVISDETLSPVQYMGYVLDSDSDALTISYRLYRVVLP